MSGVKLDSSGLETPMIKIGKSQLTSSNEGKLIWNDEIIEKPDLSGYITDTELNGKNYLTSSALTDYAKKTDLSSYVTTSTLNSKGYLTSSALTDYAKKTDLSSYATTSSLSSYIKTSTLKSYVTETWKNGRSWYRKYSDGWIEQGGYINSGSGSAGSWKTTVSLHKAYTSASTYNVILTVDDIDPNGDRTQNCGIGTYSKTSSSFSVAQAYQEAHMHPGMLVDIKIFRDF